MEDARLRPWSWTLGVATLSIPLWAAAFILASDRPMLPVRGTHYWAATWGACSVVGVTYALLTQAPLRRAAGLALMLVPVATIILGFLNSIPVLQDTGSVLRPRSTYSLSVGPARAALIDLGYVGAGAVLWFGIRAKDGLRGLAQRLAGLRLPGIHRPEGRSLLAGALWFPVLLLGTWAVDLLLRDAVPRLVSGDESRVWALMTPYHAVLISVVAAVTEEIVYRILIMGGIWWSLGRIAVQPTPTWGRLRLAIAVILQAILFGLAHGGYGTWLHVVQAGLFGLIAGIAAVWLGIWAAIALHFLIDIFAIGVHAAPAFPLWEMFLWVLLVANVLATLGYGITRIDWRGGTGSV